MYKDVVLKSCSIFITNTINLVSIRLLMFFKHMFTQFIPSVDFEFTLCTLKCTICGNEAGLFWQSDVAINVFKLVLLSYMGIKVYHLWLHKMVENSLKIKGKMSAGHQMCTKISSVFPGSAANEALRGGI